MEDAERALTPEDLFASDRDIDVYTKRIRRIADTLTEAHSSWFVITRLRGFPEQLLLPEYESLFLRLVIHNFTTVVIVGLCAAMTDRNQESTTLHNLQCWMLRQCRTRTRANLEARIGEFQGDQDPGAVLSKLKYLRDKHIAHIDTGGEQQGPALVDGLTYEELGCVVDYSRRWFNALWLPGERSLVYFQYWAAGLPVRGKDTDVDHYIDHLASISHPLHIPEQHPEDYMEHMYPELVREADTYNYWRSRLGLTTVDFGTATN